MKKLSLIQLVGLVIGSIVGGGIFNLMKDMSSGASPAAVIIGWIVTGLGMTMLAFCFQNLTAKRPDLDAGVYSYAKEGFGNYMGFNSAWGYWLSAWLGNVAYGTLLFSSIAYFVPIFENGSNLPSIIGASVMLWAVHLLILQGVESASFINTIITIAKLIPLCIFLVSALVAFKIGLFTADFWGQLASTWGKGASIPSVIEQVKSTMLVTVWVFIGIEGAVVFSGRAKKKSDVGKATIIGLIAVISIYVLVTVLSLGVMTRSELQELKQPAMAYLLESIVGKWGAQLVNVGVIISVIGAWLAWTMFAGELPYEAAKQGSFPKLFSKENKNGAPVNSLFFTNILIQIFLFTLLFTEQAYNFAYSLATSAILIPYALTGFYQLKLSLQEKSTSEGAMKNILIGLFASIFGVWLVYAAGVTNFLLTMLLYAPGLIVYSMVQKENDKPLFENIQEKIYASIIVILFIVALVGLISGMITI
ncbi:arginine:ornithine antiporter, APA family (TC 2.A.3.2.3) [Pilibacter termitis]|uniref:Arginine-ornithine antiporter n=1 Tax=Pilibacter termitis TaxID=263852 RepID=A0A1T4L5N0_9ENTE|nr:arginine-ornithine antiporter [Pilibacter termitis]SJZ49857.1 arginine:ornithine antiporter, APA family (TC 2.A.3.2.3) [Pilibacter termitis]